MKTMMMAMVILMMMRRRGKSWYHQTTCTSHTQANSLVVGKSRLIRVHIGRHQGGMAFSLFRLPPPCTDTPCTDQYRTLMPHCPTNHPNISYQIPQVHPTSYSSPYIAHNPFWWICSPTLASKNTAPRTI